MYNRVYKYIDDFLLLYKSEFSFELKKTYPADCRKIAAVDTHNSIGIERKENINKN